MYKDVESEDNLSTSSLQEESDSELNLPSFKLDENPVNDLVKGNIKTKLQTWALRNIATLTHKCMNELLLVLKSEGYNDLPSQIKTNVK